MGYLWRVRFVPYRYLYACQHVPYDRFDLEVEASRTNSKREPNSSKRVFMIHVLVHNERFWKHEPVHLVEIRE